MSTYSPKKIEGKWQKYWEKEKLHIIHDAVVGRENSMILVEFPYTSGNLHIGHWYTFAVSDMKARHLKMTGHNVLYPIGFDAFGLPAENAAIKNGSTPALWTKRNIKSMTTQLKSMGAMLDWSRMVDTSHPDYYRWTQWIFLKLYELGLAYRAKTTVNWCPKDNTVLANEQVVNGCCERCGTAVQQRDLEQWMFKTTEFADELIDELEGLDWPHTTRVAQENWIGRSRGAKIKFTVPGQSEDHALEVFTTRPDTIASVTFLAVSPELAKKWMDIGWPAPDTVKEYVAKALSKRDLERMEEKEKTGVWAGFDATHPISGAQVPIWIADYVLGSYGTGAVMGVPGYDERDGEFARKYDLPIKELPLDDAQAIIAELEKKKKGTATTVYKLRDWVLSRQRYWGAPIPMITCAVCGHVPVPEKDLPVKLPALKDFLPADDGRSPLAKSKTWLKVRCPKCGDWAERDTDTMDTFVDSSWYYLRYTDPENNKELASSEKMHAWLPVPLYVGGPEHNTMHLLYARFIAKALHRAKVLWFTEPFTARLNHSVILGPDGNRMSKSKGNVVDPDVEVASHGADAVRMYLAFMGPYSGQTMPWDPKGITGVVRFTHRVWELFGQPADELQNEEVQRVLHLTTKTVGEDIADMRYNTAVSGMMKLLNATNQAGSALSKSQREHFVKLLAPMAPHIAEELWQTVLKHKTSVHLESWPSYDEALLVMDTVDVPVQVNGRVRGVVSVPPDIKQDDIVFAARADQGIAKYVEGKETRKIIYVPGKMLNIVVGE